MSKKGIIFETLNEVKSLDIQKENDGFMHLSGVFGVCGVRNNNQRVYETKNYAKMVEAMQDRLAKAPIPGELEHPSTMNITTENISHRIDKISIDENGVVSGEITLLNTPKGKIAQAIVEGGLPLFISSRAQGQVDRNGNVTLETLQTYDLVGSPGFSQAELHLNEGQCFECLNESICFVSESTKENNEDMDSEMLKKIQEQVEELKGQIEELTEKNNSLQEQLDQKQDIDLKKLAEGIQDWIVNDYSPEVQNWIVEHYSQKIQNWVVEEFSPEVQNWIVEHYSPEVQKWIIEHYSPEVQNWIVEHYSQGVQKWLTEEAEPEMTKKLTESLTAKMNEMIAESQATDKNSKLASIDAVLNMLESQVQKPTFPGRKNQMIHENVDGLPKYIQEMPEDKRVKWEMASDAVKESIQSRAKLYNFNQEGAIQHFWESIDFDKITPSHRVNEDLDGIQDEWEKKIRMQIRNWRR